MKTDDSSVYHSSFTQTNDKKIYIYKKKNQNRYQFMVKCLNIGKNIGKPIYRSISIFDSSVIFAKFRMIQFDSQLK